MKWRDPIIVVLFALGVIGVVWQQRRMPPSPSPSPDYHLYSSCLSAQEHLTDATTRFCAELAHVPTTKPKPAGWK